MNKVLGFAIIGLLSLATAKVVGPFLAKLTYTPPRQSNAPLASSREKSSRASTLLQTLIHGEVESGRVGLPRRKSDYLLLVDISELDGAIGYTFEINGVDKNALNDASISEMQSQIYAQFREACVNASLEEFLELGGQVQQTYLLHGSKEVVLQMTLSKADC